MLFGKRVHSCGPLLSVKLFHACCGKHLAQRNLHITSRWTGQRIHRGCQQKLLYNDDQCHFGAAGQRCVMSRRPVSIVVSELCKMEGVLLDFVHDPVFIGNATGPISRQTMPEGFWLAGSFKG